MCVCTRAGHTHMCVRTLCLTSLTLCFEDPILLEYIRTYIHAWRGWKQPKDCTIFGTKNHFKGAKRPNAQSNCTLIQIVGLRLAVIHDYLKEGAILSRKCHTWSVCCHSWLGIELNADNGEISTQSLSNSVGATRLDRQARAVFFWVGYLNYCVLFPFWLRFDPLYACIYTGIYKDIYTQSWVHKLQAFQKMQSIAIYVYCIVHVYTVTGWWRPIGCLDALIRRSLFANCALILRHFCVRQSINMRHLIKASYGSWPS